MNQGDWNGDVPIALPVLCHLWLSGYSSSETIMATYLHAKNKTNINGILYCVIIKKDFHEEQYKEVEYCL